MKRIKIKNEYDPFKMTKNRIPIALVRIKIYQRLILFNITAIGRCGFNKTLVV